MSSTLAQCAQLLNWTRLPGEPRSEPCMVPLIPCCVTEED
jgi:hypothetical protein